MATAGAEPTKTGIGPVQMIAIGFGPGSEFEGRIWEELEKLKNAGTIRVLDVLFVGRDETSGELVALGYQEESLGGVVGAILGLDGDQLKAGEATTEGNPFGLSQEQVVQMAESMEPGYATGFLLVEHMWARDLKRAIRETGGIPVGEGFLTPELVAMVEPELLSLAADMPQLPGA